MVGRRHGNFVGPPANLLTTYVPKLLESKARLPAFRESISPSFLGCDYYFGMSYHREGHRPQNQRNRLSPTDSTSAGSTSSEPGAARARDIMTVLRAAEPNSVQIRSLLRGMRKKAIWFPAVDSVEVYSVDESVGTLKRDSANEKEVGHHFTDTTYRCTSTTNCKACSRSCISSSTSGDTNSIKKAESVARKVGKAIPFWKTTHPIEA